MQQSPMASWAWFAYAAVHISNAEGLIPGFDELDAESNEDLLHKLLEEL